MTRDYEELCVTGLVHIAAPAVVVAFKSYLRVCWGDEAAASAYILPAGVTTVSQPPP